MEAPIFQVIVDVFAAAIGLTAFASFAKGYRSGPEAFRKPLLAALIGVAVITVSFVLALAIPLLGFAHERTEEMHHLLIAIGVLCFLFSGRAFLAVGR